MLVTEDGAPVPEATGAVRAGAPLNFPTQTVKASTILPDLDKYKGPPLEFGRMEATASKPDVQQQFGMIVGMPNAGQLNAHRHAQHPRRALGDLQGRVRQASVARAAAAGRAAGLRDVPPTARRAGARRRARQAVRAQSRSRKDADVRRRVLVQGSVRHQGHALDRRRRRRLRHRLSRRATMCWSSSCATRARSSSPRPSTPNTTAAPAIRAGGTSPTRCCPRRSAISAAPGPAIRRTPTTPRARPRSARARARASRSAPTS